MSQFRVWITELRKRFPLDTKEQGEDAFCRGISAILLPVEEDGTPRYIYVQGSLRKEKVRSTPWYHGLYGPIPGGTRGRKGSKQFTERPLLVVRRREATAIGCQCREQRRVEVRGTVGQYRCRSLGGSERTNASTTATTATSTATATDNRLGLDTNPNPNPRLGLSLSLGRNTNYLVNGRMLCRVDSSVGVFTVRHRLR